MAVLGAMDSGLFLLLAALCAVALTVSILRRAQHRTVTDRDVTRAQIARIREQKEVRQSMDELLVQLEDLSRRINAQVDTRFAKLEALIRQADERTARLEAQLNATAPAARAPAAPSMASVPQPGTTPPASPVKPAQPPAPVKLPVSAPPEAPAPTAQIAVANVTPAVPGPAGAMLPPEERKRRVYELADADTALITIADTLQIPLGEVELILSLRSFR